MPTDLSKFLSEIPRRTRQWVHKHEVSDIMGPDKKMYPAPVNRRERRAAGRPGGVFPWVPVPNTISYTKPKENI